MHINIHTIIKLNINEIEQIKKILRLEMSYNVLIHDTL